MRMERRDLMFINTNHIIYEKSDVNLIHLLGEGIIWPLLNHYPIVENINHFYFFYNSII